MTSSEFFYAPLISSWFAAEATLLIRKLFGIDCLVNSLANTLVGGSITLVGGSITLVGGSIT